MNIGDTVQTINTLCPISGTVVEIYDNLIVISDDDAETDDDRLEFHVDDLEEVAQMYSRQQFDKDVQKLKELIRKCEELEVNNRNYTNSIHFENQINSSRYYK